MGGVLAELLAREGFDVALVTPAAEASVWMHMTMEQPRVQARLLELGVRIVPHRLLTGVAAGEAELACVFTGRREKVAAEAVVMVSARLPENALASALQARREDWGDAGIASVTTIGDALAPGTIAAAVFSGRRYAEELDAEPVGDGVPFLREVAALAPDWRQLPAFVIPGREAQPGIHEHRSNEVEHRASCSVGAYGFRAPLRGPGMTIA